MQSVTSEQGPRTTVAPVSLGSGPHPSLPGLAPAGSCPSLKLSLVAQTPPRGIEDGPGRLNKAKKTRASTDGDTRATGVDGEPATRGHAHAWKTWKPGPSTWQRLGIASSFSAASFLC